jgi:endoglycosylceramidase
VTLRQGFEEARREASVYGTTFWSGEWGFWGDAAETAAYVRRYAALEDEFQVGGAMWQWKQACGDPHSASYPSGEVPTFSGNVVVVRCGDADEPAGVEIGYVDDTVRVLSRPYPRRFPGTAEFTSDPDAGTLHMSGTSDALGPAIEVWVPGTGEPIVTPTGLSIEERHQVAGGWVIELRPEAAAWSFEVAASR